MGLDMYLTKRTYIGAQYDHNKMNMVIDITKGDGTRLNINPAKVEEVTESAGYWRKANQIHKWFVDNTQGGEDRNGESEVSKEQLATLLELCRKVKATARMAEGMVKSGEKLEGGKWVPVMSYGVYIENAEEIAELLPAQSGFFFGSTEYDQRYMEDIDNTIAILEALDLDEKNHDVSYIYCASW